VKPLTRIVTKFAAMFLLALEHLHINRAIGIEDLPPSLYNCQNALANRSSPKVTIVSPPLPDCPVAEELH
jgi:hypothetical protein